MTSTIQQQPQSFKEHNPMYGVTHTTGVSKVLYFSFYTLYNKLITLKYLYIIGAGKPGSGYDDKD